MTRLCYSISKVQNFTGRQKHKKLQLVRDAAKWCGGRSEAYKNKNNKQQRY